MGKTISEAPETTFAPEFQRAKTELKEAEKLQPGDWLVHSNDVLEILNALEDRLVTALTGVKP